jgi:hypothetical protein
MANLTVNTTNVTLTSSLTGFRTVLVQNGGAGGLWCITTADATATVNSTNGVFVTPNTTMPVPLHQEYLRVVSNSTSDVRYT